MIVVKKENPMNQTPITLALLAFIAVPTLAQTLEDKEAIAKTIVHNQAIEDLQKAMIDARTAKDKAGDAMKATREALDRAEYAKDNDCAGRDERSLECRRARERVETAKAAHGEAIAAYNRTMAEVERAEDALEKMIEA